MVALVLNIHPFAHICYHICTCEHTTNTHATHLQIMDVHSTTLAAPEFQEMQAACMGHVDNSYTATQEYVVSAFEVRCAVCDVLV